VRLLIWHGRFVGSDRKTQVLPHMPLERRKFVHDVCITANSNYE
jgi:hypothetical protein